MGFLSGLEKLGLETLDMEHLFDEGGEKVQERLEQKKQAEIAAQKKQQELLEQKRKAEAAAARKKKEEEAAAKKKRQEIQEVDLLLNKTTHCPVCDKTFMTRSVKSGKARRLQPDFDLRPRFSNIDTNKYDVASCPYCGYTAMKRDFPHLTKGQIMLVREGVCSKFQASAAVDDELATYTYEEAIGRYELALYNTVVKKGKTSEKAYACLKISWLYRGWLEELGEKGITEGEVVENCRKEEKEYYSEAYEGLVKAVASESFPVCGMEESTMNLLLANMAFRLGKTDVASKLVSSILVSPTASAQAKDRARDLKEEILEKLHNAEG